MKLIRFIAVVVMLFGVICSSIGFDLAKQASVQAQTAASTFDSSAWGYRQQFTIEGSPGGVLTNYQMMLAVYKGSGNSSGGSVFLNGHCSDDFSDIRFTKSDSATSLDYWIESYISGTSATVWVEFDSIPASPGSADFYIYYGCSAVSKSNGNNTFVFFDDFTGNSLDITKWTIDTNYWQSRTPDVNNGIIAIERLNGMNCGIYTKSTFGTNYACRARLKTAHFANWGYDENLHWQAPSGEVDAQFSNSWWPNNGKYYIHVGGQVDRADILGWSEGVYHILEIKRSSTTNVSFEVDNGNRVTILSPIPLAPLPIRPTAEYADGAEVDIDWILVKNYTSDEPTYGLWGGEEESSWHPKLGGIQIGLLSFGLVLMLLGIAVLVKGKAKTLLSGAAAVVEKGKRMPMRTKGIIVLVAGAVVVIVAIVIMVV